MAVPVQAQEQFFTQSGGRGLQNAKTNARLSKVETDVTAVQAEMAKVKPHAFAELGSCSDDGEKLRWDGANWVCEKETDPTVQGWAKKALPNCTGGTVLSAVGGDFMCAQSTAITTESDPTVQAWAKNALPSCGAGQTISANGSALVCIADERGLTDEVDPNVLGFARVGTGTVPSCGIDQVLTMTGGVLSCKLDATGITEEVDPRVQNFARTDIGGYSLAACTAGEVLRSAMLGDKVILECTSATGAVSGAMLLNDLADVETAGQTSGTILIYNNGMWRAGSEADPTVPAWAKGALSSCSAGQVLSYNGSTLSCVNDAGGSGDPLTLDSLSDVSVASATSGAFLKYSGSAWVAGSFPTCTSGQVLTGDGTNLSCVGDAGGAASPINLVELGDVRTDVNTVLSPATNDFLRWNGTKWAAVKDKMTGSLVDGRWCRYVSSTQSVECDQAAGSMALQDANNVSITGGAISVGTLAVTGTATVSGDLTVSGNLNVSGSQVIGGVLLANGGVSASGVISAAYFVGDGSGLTGVTSLGDRIASGTTAVIANQDTGTVSFTLAGVNSAAAFMPGTGLVAAGVSTTGGISGTTGFFTDKLTNAYMIDISTTQVNPLNLLRTGGNSVVIKYANAEGTLYAGLNPDEGYTFALSPNLPTNPLLTITRARQVGVGLATPLRELHVSGTALTTSWTGINFSDAANVTPTAPLEVSGTVSATRFVGDGSGLTGVVASTGDRIVSNTTSMVADGTSGYISVTQASYNTAYFHPTLGLVAVGVSSTGPISGTSGYFNDSVSITNTSGGPALDIVAQQAGSDAIRLSQAGYHTRFIQQGQVLYLRPSTNSSGSYIFQNSGGGRVLTVNTSDGKIMMGTHQAASATLRATTLSVWGGAVTTSWTGVNFDSTDITPTAPLEVSGTVSATRFVGDGSGLTGVVASTGDRIVSNTTSMVADGTSGYISVTQASYNTAYFHPTLGLVAVGISTTGRISTTDLAVRGVIDIISGTNNVLVGQDAGELRTYTSNATAAVTAVGYQAGYKTYGAYVTLMGYKAGYINSGTQVSGFGREAGSSNTGNYLTAVGTIAGYGNTGHNTTAVGYGAALSNTGSNTAVLGHRAGASNTKDALTAVGYYSGFYNSGLNGSFYGYDAGRGNSGANVTAIGYEAGYGGVSNTYGNVTLLGANTRADKDNQVVLGDYNVVEVTTTGVILAAGVSTTGTISATRFVGDGSGLTGVGVSDLYALSHVSATEGSVNSLFLGTTTGAVAAPPETTAVGVGALADPANVGPANTAVGMQALASNTTGQWNTAVGRKALRSNTTGEDNIAVGVKALDANTTGYQNVAMGMSAMSLVSNSIGNVAIGLQALGRPAYLRETVAIGFRTGQGVNNVSSFSGATLLGAYAGFGITTGNSNTLIGHRSGYGLTTGSNNIALGVGTDLYSATGSNQLNIGNVIYGDIGRGRDSRIGINVTSPTANLEVSGTVSATRFVGDGSGLTGIGASNVTVNSGVSGSLIYRDSTGALSANSLVTVSQTATGLAVFLGGDNPNTGPFTSLAPSRLETVGTGSSQQGAFSIRHVAMGGSRPIVAFKTSAGSAATPTDVAQEQMVGSIQFSPYINGNYRAAADIVAVVDGVPGAGAYPARLSFWTTAPGSTARTERMRITGEGLVGIGLTTPTATLDVSGTVRMSGTGSETCGPGAYGTMRYVSDGNGSYRMQFCRP